MSNMSSQRRKLSAFRDVKAIRINSGKAEKAERRLKAKELADAQKNQETKPEPTKPTLKKFSGFIRQKFQKKVG